MTIGLLADFAAAYTGSAEMRMDITVKTNCDHHQFPTITSMNGAVLNKIQLTREGDNCDKLEFVRVTATGTSGGIAIVQVCVLQSRCVRARHGASGITGTNWSM